MMKIAIACLCVLALAAGVRAECIVTSETTASSFSKDAFESSFVSEFKNLKTTLDGAD